MKQWVAITKIKSNSCWREIDETFWENFLLFDAANKQTNVVMTVESFQINKTIWS